MPVATDLGGGGSADLPRGHLQGRPVLVAEGTHRWLQVGAYLQDNAEATHPEVRHAYSFQKGRKWLLSPHMTDAEVAQTGLMAVIAFYEHEIREQFRVDGLTVFQPHYSLDALCSMARDPKNTLERSHPA